MKRVLVISDNEPIFDGFQKMIGEGLFQPHAFRFAFSYTNKSLAAKYADSNLFQPIHVKRSVAQIVEQSDLVISMHCKQIFPAELIRQVRCINVHPGLNPYNRGWFPQVFSILNGMPCGATIHEIDEQLDHGAIIVQRPIEAYPWDTSLSIYERVVATELELIREHLKDIIEDRYTATLPAAEGNLNLKRDFDQLCELQLDHVDTFANHLNRLRALTHGSYRNAFFRTADGRKVFVKIQLEPE